jgi:hypothetical protein
MLNVIKWFRRAFSNRYYRLLNRKAFFESELSSYLTIYETFPDKRKGKAPYTRTMINQAEKELENVNELLKYYE